MVFSYIVSILLYEIFHFNFLLTDIQVIFSFCYFNHTAMDSLVACLIVTHMCVCTHTHILILTWEWSCWITSSVLQGTSNCFQNGCTILYEQTPRDVIYPHPFHHIALSNSHVSQSTDTKQHPIGIVICISMIIREKLSFLSVVYWSFIFF